MITPSTTMKEGRSFEQIWTKISSSYKRTVSQEEKRSISNRFRAVPHLLATPPILLSRQRANQAVIKECRDLPTERALFWILKAENSAAATDAWTLKKRKTNTERKILTDSRLLFVRFLSIKAKTTCKKTDINKKKKRRNKWRKTKHTSHND